MGFDHFPSFREVPNTGVIYVMSKAQKAGFQYGAEDWANLGQGAPETGPLERGEQRLSAIQVAAETCEYAPVAGLTELRTAVAKLYNQRYRTDKISQYTYENVAISSGGRSGMSRVVASLGAVHLGHYLPDYTAYEELFEAFKGFVPIPIVLQEKDRFRASAAQLHEEIVNLGLGAVLLSNPNNPTGQAMSGLELAEYVAVGRGHKCALIFDEFYSHYLYDSLALDGPALSATRYAEDVNRDMVIVVDGLTKNWRYPGLRIAWTLGPKEVIKRIISAGSFLDGGAAHPIQSAVIPLLDLEVANQEALAIQKEFSQKRKLMINSLLAMGLNLPAPPQASFYCFAGLDSLPESLRDGSNFFEAALKYKVICVPGKFFDVNPGNRRGHIPSRLKNYVRLSFGPSKDELIRGLTRLNLMIQEARGKS